VVDWVGWISSNQAVTKKKAVKKAAPKKVAKKAKKK
jgi:hypothetical protein